MVIRRESAPPERNALRSRGCPDPAYDRRPVRYPGAVLAEAVAVISAGDQHKIRLGALEGRLRDKQAQVRRLKAEGRPYQVQAHEARVLRADWLALGGEMSSSSSVEVASY